MSLETSRITGIAGIFVVENTQNTMVNYTMAVMGRK